MAINQLSLYIFKLGHGSVSARYKDKKKIHSHWNGSLAQFIKINTKSFQPAVKYKNVFHETIPH